MALQVVYGVSQEIGKCGCIRFEDTTPNFSTLNMSGYGMPNAGRIDIIRTEIFIIDSSGNRFKVNRNYLPVNGSITICTNDLIALQDTIPVTITEPDCGCGGTPIPPPQPLVRDCDKVEVVQDCGKPLPITNFEDGCYTLEYYVYGYSTQQRVCDYSITHLKLQSDQKLWIVKNGELIDATTLINAGSLAFLQTNDEYSDYYIKHGDTIESCGKFTVSNCTTITTSTEHEVLLSSFVSNVVLLCNTEYKLSNATYKLIIDDGICTNCITDINKQQANCLLAIAWAKLEALKNNPGCNCTCIRDNLKQINNILLKITGTC